MDNGRDEKTVDPDRGLVESLLGLNDALTDLLKSVTRERNELKIMMRNVRKAILDGADSGTMLSLLNLMSLLGPPDALASDLNKGAL